MDSFRGQLTKVTRQGITVVTQCRIVEELTEYLSKTGFHGFAKTKQLSKEAERIYQRVYSESKKLVRLAVA